MLQMATDWMNRSNCVAHNTKICDFNESGPLDFSVHILKRPLIILYNCCIIVQSPYNIIINPIHNLSLILLT